MPRSPAARLGCLLAILTAVAYSGCRPKEPMYKATGQPRVQLAIRLAKTQPFPGAEAVDLPKEQQYHDREVDQLVSRLFVAKDPVLTGADVSGTSAEQEKPDPDFPNDPERWNVRLYLTDAGREKFARFTADNVGNCAAIFFDGRLETAPVVRTPIPGGQVLISGQFSRDQVVTLAQSLAGH